MSLRDRWDSYTTRLGELRDETADTLAFRDELGAEAVAEHERYNLAARALGCKPTDVSAAMRRNWERSR